jgi:hypothetical protein
VDGCGRAFDPKTYYQLQCWLLNASAVNMSYMLSVHLAAMKLNVEAGFVKGSALVYAPGCGSSCLISIQDLMAKANAALASDGYTPGGDQNRALEECLKNALNDANNNLNFVQ